MATSSRGVVLPHLRAWRHYRARSLVELATLAGVSKSTVSRAESGGVTAWESVTKLAEALHVAPHTLGHDAPPAGTPTLPGGSAPDLSTLGASVETWRQAVAQLAALADGFDVESVTDRTAVEAATETLVRAWGRLLLALAALTGRAEG